MHGQALICNPLPVLALVVFPWLILQLISNPSCMLHDFSQKHLSGRVQLQLKAMIVGDLHLSGPRTPWIDRVRRESFMKAAFKRAYQTLRPQALIILGDISDSGRSSTKEQFLNMINRFKEILGPYGGLPVHVTVGNHDVGVFYQLTPSLLEQFTDIFHGLDDTGSEVFKINDIPFVSLNAMALACDRCLWQHAVQSVVENASMNGESPVLLLHLPLFRVDERVCKELDVPKCAPWHEIEGGCLHIFDRSYSIDPIYRDMMDMLPLNTSRYLLSALKPRLVLTAHAHRFCDRSHDDGTREVTVSTFTWRNRDDPSFFMANFYMDGTIDIQQCFLARESVVLGLYALQLVALLLLIAIGGICYRKLHRSYHLKA